MCVELWASPEALADYMDHLIEQRRQRERDAAERLADEFGDSALRELVEVRG